MIKSLQINDREVIKKLEDIFYETISQNEICEEMKTNPFCKYIYYEENGIIKGYTCYYIVYERLEIANIYVVKEYRNQKIASKMLDYIINSNKDKINITLEVRIDNNIAINLYKSKGFVEKATRKNYYNGIDGILMEKTLVEKKDIYVLGIESSCDETSFSIVKNGTEEIATVISSQIDIHKEYGGVVPEIASRAHVKNVTFVLEECLKKAEMTMEQIDMIAIANGPGLIGSLLIGLETAKTLAWLYNKPLIPVHHIAGHIYANNLVKRMTFPLIALVISGGHTELIYMEKDYSFKKLGGTLDDAVGECYDKIGRIINIEYPAGPKIDNLASIGKPTYKLPIPLNDESYNFSFSGLKSAVINLVHNEEQKNNEIIKEDLAASFQNIVVESLSKKTMKALKNTGTKNLVLAGGVSANKGIRTRLQELCEFNKIEYTFPDIKYCTDNAAMIASAGYYAYLDGRRADYTLNSESTMELK